MCWRRRCYSRCQNGIPLPRVGRGQCLLERAVTESAVSVQKITPSGRDRHGTLLRLSLLGDHQTARALVCRCSHTPPHPTLQPCVCLCVRNGLGYANSENPRGEHACPHEGSTPDFAFEGESLPVHAAAGRCTARDPQPRVARAAGPPGAAGTPWFRARSGRWF